MAAAASASWSTSLPPPPPPPEIDPSFSSLSPFRLGLWPRCPHPVRRRSGWPLLRYDNVAGAAASSPFNNNRDRCLLRQQRYFSGRLTLALMMIVDAIDSAATTTITGDGGSLTAGGGGPPRPRIPTLHQPDGRRGGGGGGAATAASLSGGGYDRHRDNDGRAIAMGEGEDSSLTMARDFLSRLVSCGARIVVIFLLNLNMFILFFLLDIFPSPSHPLSSLFL